MHKSIFYLNMWFRVNEFVLYVCLFIYWTFGVYHLLEICYCFYVNSCIIVFFLFFTFSMDFFFAFGTLYFNDLVPLNNYSIDLSTSWTTSRMIRFSGEYLLCEESICIFEFCIFLSYKYFKYQRQIELLKYSY